MQPGVSARRKTGSLRSKTGTGDIKGKMKGEKKCNKKGDTAEEQKANYSSNKCIKN